MTGVRFLAQEVLKPKVKKAKLTRKATLKDIWDQKLYEKALPRKKQISKFGESLGSSNQGPMPQK